MPKNDSTLDWNLGLDDLSSISLDDESLENIDIDDVDDSNYESTLDKTVLDTNDNTSDEAVQTHKSIDESVFLDSGDNVVVNKNVLNDEEKFWSYLRWFFLASGLILLWVLAIGLFYGFSIYLREASKPTPDTEYAGYVSSFKEKYKKVKDLVWLNVEYETPVVWSEQELSQVNMILDSDDLDYIEKKDLLSPYVSNLVNKSNTRLNYLWNLKQEIAKQWFLPEELESLLSEDQAIDTIQRSLNALEVIKFSTASRVFMYMNTALSTVSEMIRVTGASVENLRTLFSQLNSRWEKDIASYVYMCYLNPFEVNANCDTVWDLDLYYNLAKDDSINISLFKNAMNAISQLLEKEDTSLFSITFNGFNAKDKNIQFNIEVFTNQEDERNLLQQWKKNPNIFILTNIINLLKQSSFIIWAEINTKEINVDTRIQQQWNISRPIKYSTMDFTVPIQKDTEREIFDYIDLESMKKLLWDRWFEKVDEMVRDESVENIDEMVRDESVENIDDLDNEELQENMVSETEVVEE